MSDQPLILRAQSVGPWPMNTYAMICPTTRQSVLFDPGAEPEKLMALLSDSTPVAIILTHTHGDHIGELQVMRERLQVPVLASPGPYARPITADQFLADGQIIPLGSGALRTYATPGHTADMLSFADVHGNDIIVGDTIFAGGPGRTWSAEDFRTTIATLQHVILTWPDTAICHPGHGPSFRLGEQRAAIEAFVQRDHGDFFGDAVWDV